MAHSRENGSELPSGYLVALQPQEWETLCYHPPGPITVREMVDIRLTELAMHGWDIRSALASDIHLSPGSLSALVETIPRAVRRAFRPDLSRTQPIRYRFVVTEPIAVSADIALDQDGGRVEPATTAVADVTFQCDTETYVLIMFGRHPLEEATADGRVVIEGPKELANAFSQSFQGG